MEVKEQIRRVEQVIKEHRGYAIQISKDPAHAQQMWKARKEALWSASAAYPDREAMITDVCVPLSNLADLMDQTKEEIKASFLPTPLVAHAGDGNFHAFIMFDPQKVSEKRRRRG